MEPCWVVLCVLCSSGPCLDQGFLQRCVQCVCTLVAKRSDPRSRGVQAHKLISEDPNFSRLVPLCT